MFFLRKPSTNNQFILLKFTDSSQDSDFVSDLASLPKKIGNKNNKSRTNKPAVVKSKRKYNLFMSFTLLNQNYLTNLVNSTNFNLRI